VNVTPKSNAVIERRGRGAERRQNSRRIAGDADDEIAGAVGKAAGRQVGDGRRRGTCVHQTDVANDTRDGGRQPAIQLQEQRATDRIAVWPHRASKRFTDHDADRPGTIAIVERCAVLERDAERGKRVRVRVAHVGDRVLARRAGGPHRVVHRRGRSETVERTRADDPGALCAGNRADALHETFEEQAPCLRRRITWRQ
jgi:hypothetical protein